VATDQKSSVIDDELAQTPSAIENELSTYRAISQLAIFSLICGVLALFSFAHLFFLAFAILAVVFGILANRAITRLPDMLTGRRLANAGMALGLVFGLISSTYTIVQSLVLTREAQQFGQKYRRFSRKGLWATSFGTLPTPSRERPRHPSRSYRSMNPPRRRTA